jgi:hypothetical protein
MTFDFVRAGWPNTAAVAALAILPMVALAFSTVAPSSSSEIAKKEFYTYYDMVAAVQPTTSEQ